jgi:hypothetical protein
MGSKFTELIVDCADPRRLAEFWSAVLGWQPTGRYDEDVYDDDVEIAGPPGSGPSLVFVRVPEAKTVKNRLHIDVNPVGCTQEQEVERLIGLGARRIDIGQGEPTWIVLADPEGNEFCVLQSRVE